MEFQYFSSHALTRVQASSLLSALYGQFDARGLDAIRVNKQAARNAAPQRPDIAPLNNAHMEVRLYENTLTSTYRIEVQMLDDAVYDNARFDIWLATNALLVDRCEVEVKIQHEKAVGE